MNTYWCESPQSVPQMESWGTRINFSLFLQGNFTHTLMYYGYYSNFTLNDPCAFSSNSTYCRVSGHVYLPYNMPLAYLSVIGVAFFVMCIVLVYRWETTPVLLLWGLRHVCPFSSWNVPCIFLSGRTSALLLALKINRHVDVGKSVDIVYLDFEKAFNMVFHQRLM